MSNITNINLDYSRPVKIADGIYWVGFHDPQSGSQANPYLILDGEEAVVIDSGSRSAFPTVMMKIMQTGVTPSSIAGLIYQSYDPRICGSIPHFESIIDRTDLKIISDETNYMFIQHYSESATFLSLSDVRYEFRFSSGRSLEFVKIPYAHAAGSFITFDHQTGILFTSDMFSNYSSNWELFLNLPQRCKKCNGERQQLDSACTDEGCTLQNFLKYHKEIMTSERALKLALERVVSLPFTTIAPQQGSIIHEPDDLVHLCELLSSLRGVGIDRLVGDRSYFELGNINPLRKRLGQG